MIRLALEYWPVVFVGLALVIARLFAKYVLVEERFPYHKRPSLLTKPELTFYRALHQAADGRWSIHAMVRMADLLQVRPDAPKPHAWRNRIQSKHIDFLLCDLGSMEAKLAVELDDPAQPEAERLPHNRFVSRALGDAGVRLLRVEVQESYDPAHLRKTLEEQLA